LKVKVEGFHLLSKESLSSKEKQQQQQQQHQQQQLPLHQQQSSSEGDSWIISFCDAENKLLNGSGGSRRKCLAILNSLQDRHLDLPGRPINNYVMKTLVLYECEKHPYDTEWTDACLGERINGITLQLIACLQSRKCPAYFMPSVDIFKGKDPMHLDMAAKKAWVLHRELLFNPRCLDNL
jgi:putative nucleotidyltransferase